jgi:hypothetical protein
MFRGPRQERFVVDTRQAGILRADDVDFRFSAEQRPENVVIEILVGQLAQRYSCRRAVNRSRIPTGGQMDSLDLLVSRMSWRRRSR